MLNKLRDKKYLMFSFDSPSYVPMGSVTLYYISDPRRKNSRFETFLPTPFQTFYDFTNIQRGPKKCIHSLLINTFGINLNEISIPG